MLCNEVAWEFYQKEFGTVNMFWLREIQALFTK